MSVLLVILSADHARWEQGQKRGQFQRKSDDVMIWAFCQALRNFHLQGRSDLVTKLKTASTKLALDGVPSQVDPVDEFFSMYQQNEDFEKRGEENSNNLAFKKMETLEFLSLCHASRGLPTATKDLMTT